MIELLVENPLLLLFVVAAIGYPLGRIRFAGISLGVAAVLFVGLAFGALDPRLKIPAEIYELGLIIFVYTIGLTSGPGFFAALRRKGLRDNLLVLLMVVLAACLTFGAFWLLDLPPTIAAGMFAGSLTNTPALAGVLSRIAETTPPGLVEQLQAEPVVGYSVTYPMGILAALLSIVVLQRLWKVDYAVERLEAHEPGAVPGNLESRTVVVTRAEAGALPVRDLAHQQQWDVVIGRVRHHGQVGLASGETRLAPGDLISVVGIPAELDKVTAFLGEASAERLELDRSQVDYRRIFVSKPAIAGRRLRDLNLPQLFSAVVTRVRRGDIELLPHGDTVLELGDRVRVVAPRANMPAISRFFGDSYKALSEIDVLSFSLGIALGMLLGQLPIPLPGGITVRLGAAGGPLVSGLILGTLARSGPVVWTLPYSANLVLRQTGLVLFLAGIGTRAGYSFVSTAFSPSGFAVFLAGALITSLTSLMLLVIGRQLLKIPMNKLIGMLAGLQTQPAVLSFAAEQSGDDLPNVGYATVVPVAMVAKIVTAQLLLIFMQGAG